MPLETPPSSGPAPGRVPVSPALRADVRAVAAGLLATLVALIAIAPWDLAASMAFARTHASEFGAFVQTWGPKPTSVLVVGATFVLTSHAVRASRPGLARASAALLAQFILHPTLLTNLLKLVAGRPRPLLLGPAGEGFTPFWVLAPGLGDFSFPSGHVAIAMVLAPCALLLWREGRRGASLAVATATLAWAGVVAVGRVRYGAHFPSDVTFSMGLGVALAPLSVRLGDRGLRRLARTPFGESRGRSV